MKREQIQPQEEAVRHPAPPVRSPTGGDSRPTISQDRQWMREPAKVITDLPLRGLT